MKNRILLLTFLLSVAMTVLGQNISRQQADSMVNALKKKKQGIERIDLLLNLAQFHILKPGEQQIDFDSAKVLIDQAASLNKSLNSPDAQGYLALTESYLLKEKGQKEEGRKMVEKAVSILETTSNKHYLGRACYELSGYYAYADSQERLSRIKMVERAITYFEQAGTLNHNAYSLEMLGDLYSYNQEYAKAIQILNRAIDAYNSAGNPKLQGVYVLIGQCYKEMKDYPQALLYTLKALKAAHHVGDTSMQLCQINNVLGGIYYDIGNKETAVKYIRDGFEVAKKHNDEVAIYGLAVSLCVGYNDFGQPAKALEMLDLIPENIRRTEDQYIKADRAVAYLRTYTALRQFDKARKYYDTLLNYDDNNKLIDAQKRLVYSMCANYFISTNQFQKARYYLEKNIDVLKKFKFGNSHLLNSQMWYKLDSAEGNFQSAFNHLNFYKGKMDSIFNINKMRQLQVLGVEYETALKEDSIKAKNRDIDFLTQKNTLQAANLKQSALIRNITIIGIILALIILGLLYRQYQHKQKNNRVITQKNEQLQQIVNEKEWLLKEIHHRVKNNLQIIMSLLNSQSVYTDDHAALTAIHDSQRRVHAISLIHQKLYQSENASSIAMPQYVYELVNYLRDSFGTGSNIVFEQDIEPLDLDVSQAIPVGLIINEGIVNAIKYAFPDKQKGVVKIKLQRDGDDHLLLKISDNGIGLPAELDIMKHDSLGLDLMKGLAKQLNGNFTMENDNGVHIMIRFIRINHLQLKTA